MSIERMTIDYDGRPPKVELKDFSTISRSRYLDSMSIDDSEQMKYNH